MILVSVAGDWYFPTAAVVVGSTPQGVRQAERCACRTGDLGPLFAGVLRSADTCRATAGRQRYCAYDSAVSLFPAVIQPVRAENYVRAGQAAC